MPITRLPFPFTAAAAESTIALVSREFTIGVEEEYQIIDPETRELKSLITQLIEANTALDWFLSIRVPDMIFWLLKGSTPVMEA